MLLNVETVVRDVGNRHPKDGINEDQRITPAAPRARAADHATATLRPIVV